MEGVGVNTAFWRDKRVFITGHTGFKGGWLSLWLQNLGAQVTGYALAPATTPSLFEVAQVAQGMSSKIGDVRDATTLTSAIRHAAPEIVFHLAAQPLVRHSYADPVGTYTTNVIGTINVLEAVRKTSSVRAVVNVTTDKCYENKDWVWGYRETDTLGGFDPYSSSKACAELVTASYRNAFFSGNDCNVALASARAGNVIGGGDWAPDRLIPDALHAISTNQPIVLRNPDAIRPWQHVLEPISGYLLLAQHLYEHGKSYAQAFNFGPDDADTQTVNRVVQQLGQHLGVTPQLHLASAGQPHETHQLKLDCAKAKSLLGWEPRWHLSRALDATAQWHSAHISSQTTGANLREVCLKQIDVYACSSSQN